MGRATILRVGAQKNAASEVSKNSFGMYPHLLHSGSTTQNKEKMELTIFVFYCAQMCVICPDVCKLAIVLSTQKQHALSVLGSRQISL